MARKRVENYGEVASDTQFVYLAQYVTYGAGVAPEVRKANRTGYQTAYDLANKLGKTLYQNAGDVEIEIDETGDFDGSADKPFWIGVRLDGDVNIVGAGITRTRIKFFPDTPTFNAYAFFQPSGRHNSISDCTISGPAVGIGTPEDDGLPNFHGIKHQGEANAEITDETLTLWNVKIDGKFYDALASNEGDLICTLDGCDFSAHLQAIGYFVNFDTHKQLIIRNCYFHDCGYAFDAAELVYVSPGVAIDISHSRFSACLRYGIYINGSSTVKPLYSRISNNVFEDTLAHAIQVMKNNRPLIQGNLIKTYARGIAFFGSYLGAEVIDNEFMQTEAAGGREGDFVWQSIGGSCESGALVKVHGNTFDASLGRDVGLTKIIHMEGSKVIWDIADNVFRLNRSNLAAIIGSEVDLLAFVSRNRFTGEACDSCMQFDGGKIYANANIVETGSGRAFSFIADTLVKAYVDDNYVNASTEPLHIALTTASDGKIEGGGNTFLKDSVAIVNRNPLFNFQMITPRQGVNPKVVATAEEVQLSISYDTFHLAGAGPIKWFYFAHGFATRLFSGEVRIIFDDEGASTVEGGNIKPQTTEARVVGKVYRFVLDSRTGFWYE